MRLLLGSGGFRGAERVDVLVREMRSFFGPIARLLFVPHALRDHDRYVEELEARGLNAGYELDGLHRHKDPVQAVRNAEAIYVGGGNTFRLLAEIQRLDLLPEIRQRVRDGAPYLGISAGANLACPTIQTTNDMPITMPADPRALGLVPFQINTHYYDGPAFLRQGDQYIEHCGEMREERIRQFHELNDTPVIGLWEGGILRVEGDSMTLYSASARLFRKNQPVQDLRPGRLVLDGIGMA